MNSTTATEEAPWIAGAHSIRSLAKPGLVLQGAALALVLAYYYVPAAHAGFALIGTWHTQAGYFFSAAASALCGGLLPFLYLRTNASTRASHPWNHLWFFALFWAWKGAEVDLWYRILGAVYGNNPDVTTILCKVASDQFVYNVLWATPAGNFLFAWKDAGFRWPPVLADVRAGRWYYRRVLPVLLTVWALWIPVVCCVYALPAALQIPLFNVVLCFWSLLFAHVTARQKSA